MAKKSEEQKDISSTAVEAALEKSDAASGSSGVKSRVSGRSAKKKASAAPEASGSVVSDIPAAPEAFAGAAEEQPPAGAKKPPVTEVEQGKKDPVAVADAKFEGTEFEDPGFEDKDEPAAQKASCGSACELLRSFNPTVFLTALAFLTRLGPAGERSQEEMRASMLFYPLVGLLLGVVALIPAWLIPAGYFWLKAWAFAVIIVWLTRGLHWDGLADLADALGSNRSGADFQAVLKDSRSGVFAVLAVVFCALGYVFAAQSLLLSESWLPLILAPALARCAPLYIANLSRPNADSSLGKLLAQGVDLKIALAWTTGLALVAVLAGYVLAAILALVVACAVLYWLLNLAERHDGYNGDFMGAGIVLVELGVLLAFALA